MTTSPSTIQQVTYTSEVQGPKLLVLGGVHGNETCGPIAIRRVLAEFESGALKLARGQVTFVPVCNPEAARLGVRFVERNLNRFLVPMAQPDTYEARLGNILCPLLEACDVLLDLHSYSVGGDAFTFVSAADGPERAFADCLGPATLMTGWSDAYANTGRQRASHPDESTGTTEYLRRFGGYGVTLECGQHDDPQGPRIAYDAVHNALRHLGLIEGEKPALPQTRLITVRNVIYRDQEGTYAKDWKNLHPVVAGELIATYADGTELRAEGDGVIIMPHWDCGLGAEWYYFGTE